MRFPNQRLAQLFTLLRNETLPQDELAQRLSVSTRTVRADITALNALLAQYGAQFILNRGSGYQLKIDDPLRFQTLEEAAPKTQHVPRTAQDRINFLLVRFLTSAFSIKLEDLADEWFVSRATLQNDMVEVRERFQRYQLTLETRPRHGMKLFGSEVSIRACLTDLLWELTQQGGINPLISAEALEANVPAQLEPVLQETLTRHHIRLTDVGERFICLYGAVVVRRVSEGYPLADFSAEDVAQNVRDAARDKGVAVVGAFFLRLILHGKARVGTEIFVQRQEQCFALLLRPFERHGLLKAEARRRRVAMRAYRRPPGTGCRSGNDQRRR